MLAVLCEAPSGFVLRRRVFSCRVFSGRPKREGGENKYLPVDLLGRYARWYSKRQAHNGAEIQADLGVF